MYRTVPISAQLALEQELFSVQHVQSFKNVSSLFSPARDWQQ